MTIIKILNGRSQTRPSAPDESTRDQVARAHATSVQFSHETWHKLVLVVLRLRLSLDTGIVAPTSCQRHELTPSLSEPLDI